MLSKFSIRTHQLLWLLAAGLLPILCLLWASRHYLHGEIRRDAFQQMNENLNVAETLVLQEHRDHLREISSLASNASLFNPDSEEEGKKQYQESLDLKHVEKVYNVFQRENSLLTLFNLDGSPIETNTIYNVRNRQSTRAFQSAVSGTPYTVPPHRLKKGGALHLAFYHPVRNRYGKINSVVRHYYPMEEITSNFHSLFSQGEFLLLDEKGRLLSGVDNPEQLLRPISETYKFESYNLDEVEECYDSEGQAQLMVSRKIPSLGDNQDDWQLIHLMPKKHALIGSERAKQGILLTTALTLPLLGLFGYVASYRLARPIRKAALAASQVARGQYDVNLPEGDDFREMKLLARAFEAMTREVRRKKDFLESEIEKRTDRLQEITAYLTSSLDSIEDAIILVDADSSEIRYANQTAKEFFGDQATLSNSYAPLFAHHAGKFINSEKDEEDWLSWWRRLSISKVRGERRFQLLREGKEGSVQVISSAVNHPDSGKVGRLWLFRDLTKSEKLEAELLQSNKMEAIGRLAGGVAHDFNNILTTIQGSIEIAGSDYVKGRNPRKSLGIGMNACSQAAQVVQQLLTFSRQHPVRLQKSSLPELINETVELLEHGMDPKNSIEVHLEEDLPFISADPSQIHQVIMNLLINALQAMPDGGVVNIHAEEVEVKELDNHNKHARSGHYCKLSIEDEGIGMDEVVREKIFDPFYTTKEMDQGSGLGLSTSLGILQRHKGWIDCRSAQGVGTVFDIYLPCAESSSEAAIETPEDNKKVPKVQGNILIVDDDVTVRSLGKAFLEDDGHHITEAEDGLQALEILNNAEDKNEFDLVILDLSMPRLSGAEALEAIRTLSPDLPVLIWSGYSKDGSSLLKEDAKVKPEAFLQKPFLSGDLKMIVRELLLDKKSGSKHLVYSV